MWKIINPYKMAVAAHDNQVSQREFGVYISIFVFLSIIGIVIPLFIVPLNEKLLIVFDSFLSLAIAYVINKKADNAQFWYRFISVNVSIGIMLALLSAIVGAILYLIFQSPPDQSISIGIWIIVLSNILLYKYMCIASGITKEKTR